MLGRYTTGPCGGNGECSAVNSEGPVGGTGPSLRGLRRRGVDGAGDVAGLCLRDQPVAGLT
jgi:hypothetical protein